MSAGSSSVYFLLASAECLVNSKTVPHLTQEFEGICCRGGRWWGWEGKAGDMAYLAVSPPLWVTGAVSGLSFGEQWQLSTQKGQWSQDICLVKADAQMERKEGH